MTLQKYYKQFGRIIFIQQVILPPLYNNAAGMTSPNQITNDFQFPNFVHFPSISPLLAAASIIIFFLHNITALLLFSAIDIAGNDTVI